MENKEKICYFIDLEDDELDFPIVEGVIEEENEKYYKCSFNNRKKFATFNKETLESKDRTVYMFLTKEDAEEERIAILENYLDWHQEKIFEMIQNHSRKDMLLKELKGEDSNVGQLYVKKVKGDDNNDD